MKRTYYISIAVFIICINVVNVTAISNEKILDSISEKIQEDCYGKDIELYNPHGPGDSLFPDTSSNKLFKTLDWPFWNYSDIKTNLRKYREIEPFMELSPSCDKIRFIESTGTEPFGCGIIRCGENQLDAIADRYYWNDEKIEVSKEGDEYNIEIDGDKNTVVIGDDNNIIVTFQENSLIIGLIVSIIGGLLSYFIIFPHSTRKKRIIYSIIVLSILLILIEIIAGLS